MFLPGQKCLGLWCHKQQLLPVLPCSTLELSCDTFLDLLCPRSQTWLWCHPDTLSVLKMPLKIQKKYQSVENFAIPFHTAKNSKLLTSNCAFLILMKLPFDKSQNQTWFSNSRFTCEIQDNIVSRLHKNCHVKLSKENSVYIKFCKYNFIFLIKSKSNYCFIRNQTHKNMKSCTSFCQKWCNVLFHSRQLIYTKVAFDRAVVLLSPLRSDKV